jgi:tetratricopeptide (TPR) repeat protein
MSSSGDARRNGRRPPFLNSFLIARTLTQLRFAQWDDALALDEPADDAIFLRGIHHYAHGLALAAQGELEAAQAEADRLTELATGEAITALELPEAFLPGASMLRIAEATLQGEIQRRDGRPDEALSSLQQAVALQDTLPYFEPPYWFVSARLHLGHALLELDRPAEAEAVYRADLEQYPHNGWALRGLALSLEAQGEPAAAEEVAARFEAAWQHADVAFAEESVTLGAAP